MTTETKNQLIRLTTKNLENKKHWQAGNSKKYYNQFSILDANQNLLIDGVYFSKIAREICEAHNKSA